MKKAQDIMVNDVVTTNPEMSVAAAAKLMLTKDVGCLVVLEQDKIKGIVTDRDLMACAIKQHNIQECSISNHMSSPVLTTPSDALLINLAKLMAAKQIKRVPVIEEGELVGIVSFSDIAEDMDEQVAGMWSEWLELIAVTKTSAQHRRGKRFEKKTSTLHHSEKRVEGLIRN
jgi:CBS domain-containing protein